MARIKVTVTKLGGESKTVEVREGATVSDVLEASGISYSSKHELRVNAQRADFYDELDNYDVVQLIPNIEGGQG